ncbi:MAG: PH domain-containing protein [Terracidiphilus sp.]|jgi:hypothetical protein
MSPLQKQSFAASYDLAAKIISSLVVVVLLVIFIFIRSALVGVIDLCILALAYLYSPQSYELSDGAILIKRLIGAVRLPLDSIRELRTGNTDDFKGCIRLWASGGLFGYFGLFRTSKLGKCKWYMTNRRNSVIIVASAMTAVISPDNVSGFLAAVRSLVSVPESKTSESLEAPKARANIGAWIGGIIGGFIAVFTIGIVCVALMYSPGPPVVTLTSTTLTIHDYFYPVTLNAADIDVSGIKIVNIKTDHEWTPTERTNGFANTHYHSGWFQVANGSVRMYWANGENLVLLPSRHNGTPVLVQVNNPEQFIDRVRRQWANN